MDAVRVRISLDSLRVEPRGRNKQLISKDRRERSATGTVMCCPLEFLRDSGVARTRSRPEAGPRSWMRDLLEGLKKGR